MGYSHYWQRRHVLPLPQFSEAVEDCRKLCQALAIPLGDAQGRDQPIFNRREICFNGHVDSGGLYETFRIERIDPRPFQEGQEDWSSDFCKTNYRPYDLAVQCCLIILHHHLSSELFRVSSDGNSAQWNDARDACQHVLGYGMDWGEDQLAPVAPGGQVTGEKGETSP